MTVFESAGLYDYEDMLNGHDRMAVLVRKIGEMVDCLPDLRVRAGQKD
jgi:hypothetical protein